MRDEQTIERELAVAREDLETRLTQLRVVIQDKLAIGKRMREAIERRLLERPLASIAAAFGLGALAGLVTSRRIARDARA